MDKRDFTPLHVHTQYSLLDGVIKIEELVKRVKELGMTACAITDHGNLHGAIEFYKECRKNEVKPILGCEAYITEDPDDTEKEKRTRDNRHMVLLAQNSTGFKNLVWLINRAHLNNFYYKPRISWKHLQERSEGLIATSACLAGIVAKTTTMKGDQIDQQGGVWDSETKVFDDYFGIGEKWALRMKAIFGDRFYIEIQPHIMWEQTAFNKWAIKFAKSHQIPLVVTTDAHYLKTEDRPIRDLIMAQQMKTTLAEHQLKEKENGYTYVDCSIREPNDIYEFCTANTIDAEEAFWNTRKIADSCNIELQLGSYQYPAFNIADCGDYQDFLAWQERKCSILDPNQNERPE